MKKSKHRPANELRVTLKPHTNEYSHRKFHKPELDPSTRNVSIPKPSPILDTFTLHLY